MILAVLILAGGLGLALLSARRRSRAGWLALPVAPFALLAVWMSWAGMGAGGELAALVAGAGACAIAAAGLPRLDRFLALPIGLGSNWAFAWLLPQGGPDSPAPLLFVACIAGFLGGAVAGIVASLGSAAIRRRRSG